MTYNVSEAEINTKDKKRIMIDNYAVWKITNPREMISNARNIVNAETRMSEFIYSVVRTELGQLDYVDVVNDENSERGSLNDRVTESVNEFLDHGNFGIEIVDVRMKRIDLPEENEQSIYTRMISERQSTAQTYLSEGDADKSRIEAETDREVTEMLATAKKKQPSSMLKASQKPLKFIMIHFRKIRSFITYTGHCNRTQKLLAKIR